MAINFKRGRMQERLEKIIDPSYNYQDKSKAKVKEFANKIQDFRLSEMDVADLRVKLLDDAEDFLYSGLISVIEGINNFYNGCFSWGGIQLYYSLFYLCRAKLAFSNFAIFRASKMYIIECLPNAKMNNFPGKEYNTTHEGTFNFFREKLPNHYILSNTIDAIDCLDWFKNLREIINYRSPSFCEPNHLSIFECFDSKEKLDSNILNLYNDLEGDIFLEEFAVVGIPLKFLSCILRECNIDINDTFSDKRLRFLRNLACQKMREVLMIN